MNVWVTWKELGPLQIEWKYPVIHLQGEGGKTACGIHYGINWVFECHDNYDSVSCKRCSKSKFNLKRVES